MARRRARQRWVSRVLILETRPQTTRSNLADVIGHGYNREACDLRFPCRIDGDLFSSPFHPPGAEAPRTSAERARTGYQAAFCTSLPGVFAAKVRDEG